MKEYCVMMINEDVIFFKCPYDSVLEVADWLSHKKYVDIVDTSGYMHVIFRKYIVMIKEIS